LQDDQDGQGGQGGQARQNLILAEQTVWIVRGLIVHSGATRNRYLLDDLGAVRGQGRQGGCYERR
jgi:hypothetical protein